jgi:hypothetical protein
VKHAPSDVRRLKALAGSVAFAIWMVGTFTWILTRDDTEGAHAAVVWFILLLWLYLFSRSIVQFWGQIGRMKKQADERRQEEQER